jgi:type VI secretion system protein ImpL
MMSLRRIFGLILLFLFFEVVVAVVTTFVSPQTDVLYACLAMTGLAVATWMIFFLITRLAAQRAAKPAPQLKAIIPAQKASDGDGGFTLEFTSLIEEANGRLQSLTSTDGKNIAPTISTLPLFLVLGAEGSGKTTAIINSGLEPRLLAGETQRDGTVVPTARANIWYAEGVIFLELAGRLLMQEPTRWEKALQILSQQRRIPRWRRLLLGNQPVRTNLRGVVLVCEAEAFLKSRDVNRLSSIARTLNERMQSLQSAMRVDFPAYMLFTRCDSVPYFQEFFAQLSDSDGRRILGSTLPFSKADDSTGVYADREGNRLKKLFNRLYQAISDKRLLVMAREESIEKRAYAYEFPRELKKLRGEMVQFLLDAFRPSALQAPVRFRGFYFSGRRLVPRAKAAVSEDTGLLDRSVVYKPLDATVIFSSNRSSTLEYSNYAASPANTTTAKWVFLTDLFKNVILGDPAGRVIVPLQRISDSKQLNIAFGAAGVLCLLFSIFWAFSWQRNHSLLTNVEAAVTATRNTARQTPLDALPDLQTLLPSMQLLHSYNRGGSPLSYHWGLYAGKRAAEQLDRLYYARFRQGILEPVLNAMSSQFLQLQANSPVSDDIYKELKTYRTVTSGSCKPDDALVASTMLPVWSEAVTRDTETQSIVGQQIQFYASELKIEDPYHSHVQENGDAVTRAQIYLQGLTGSDKILQDLLNQVRQLPAEHLSAYASNYSQVLTGPDQVEAPYTRAGWNNIEDSIRDHKIVSSGEPCVVGSGTNVSGWGDSAMDSEVQKRYSDSYVQAWKQFLEGHHIIPYTSAMDASQKLSILADNNRSPLLALVYMTSANTNVAVPQSLRDRAAGSLQGAAAGAGNTVKSVFNKISGGGKKQPTPPSNDPQPVVLETVAGSFDPVHAMVDPGSRDKWLNDKNQAYVKALGDLGSALQMLPPQVHLDVQPETQQLEAAKTALSNADAALRSLAANFPNTPTGVDIDLQNLLREPIDLARRTVASIQIAKAPPVGTGGGSPVVVAADPSAALKIKATIKQVNSSAVGLCSAEASLQHKFPFDASSTTDASIDEINGLLQPGQGAYSQFSNLPDVSKTYNHTGKIWAAKPEFPATPSQPFLNTLNGFGEAQEELYSASASAPHLDLTLTVDGTGKIPFELEVDGHTMKFKPGRQTPPLRLVWPPITNAPAKLVPETGGKSAKMFTMQYTGLWALFHLLQAADEQSGNVFTFRNVQIGHSLNPLANEKGVQGTIQIRIDSAASNLFSRGYFSKLRCNDTWALQQNPGN